MNRQEQLQQFSHPSQVSMEWHSKNFILQAIEDLEDYIPMLEQQDAFNHTIASHSVAALRGIFENYQIK